MRKMLTALVCLVAAMAAAAEISAAPAPAPPATPNVALTIYNRDFAVVRQSLTLNLAPGVNRVSFPDATLLLEPDSVILRDTGSHRALQVLEQNYRNDPVSQELMLSLYEGKTIDFIRNLGGKEEVVQGKVIRSGYVPHSGSIQPIIEIDGRLQFYLPG